MKTVRRLRIWDGLRAFFGGVGFVVGRPSVWGYAAVPVMWLVVLGGGLSALGILGATRAAEAFFSGSTVWSAVGQWVLLLLLSAVAVLVAVLVAFALAQPLSGFALDRIARKQETELGGKEWPEPPLLDSMRRSVAVTLTGLAISLPILALLTVIELLAPPAVIVTLPLKFIVSALLLAWDFFDYPLGLRGASVGDRMRFIGRNFAAVLAFGSLGAVVLLVPGLGVLLLPFGVAGAARMVVWDDRLAAGVARLPAVAPQGALPAKPA